MMNAIAGKVAELRLQGYEVHWGTAQQRMGAPR
jgi:hypothetical protein